MIAAHRLPPGCLKDPELRIPMTAVAGLLEDSAARSGRPDFALKLAERRSLSNIGALALLVREQPTIGKALEALADYMHLHSDGLKLTIEAEDESLAIIALAIDSGRPVPVRQGVELALGFIHKTLQQLLGRSWRPQTVCFMHSPPARKDAHRRFFGTNVEFGRDCNAIVCLAADIDAPVPTSDPAMADHARRYLDSLAPRANVTMRDNARECIQALLPSGLCSADRVAKHLGVDRRTLHRHLARDGETFLTLVDSVRSELAIRYIDNRERPLASVAELLGFSALSAFSRWFRGRFGCSVSQWRTTVRRPGISPPLKAVSTPTGKP
jgi:AraC-like DNA-binding protein